MSLIEEYKELLKSRLSEYRYHHSLCVADSAVELAKRYGADCDKAFLAGLLHDITKEADKQEHFELFKLAGVELTALECVNHKLWHAMSGAVYIKEKLNIIIPGVKFSILYTSLGISNCWNINSRNSGSAIAKIILSGSRMISLKFRLAKFTALTGFHLHPLR